MPAIGVFWDIENCAVPHGKSALALVQKIREKLFAGKREVEFMCVCDTSKESRDVIQELNYAQVTVVHVHATSKNAADDKLRQSLHRFADAYPPQSTAVLLSGDVNFTSELSDLRYRHHHYVILVHPSSAQDALLSCAHECHSYEELVNDLPFRAQKKPADGSTELIISGLPRGKSNRALQSRLEMLSDNCGGKVFKVFASQALLRFPSSEAATRAKKRLQEEDVFGAKINVDFPDRATSQYWKRPDTNAYYSPRIRPKNRNIINIQRSHSLSPEPRLQDSSFSVNDCKEESENDSCSPTRRRGSLEFRRRSPFRAVVYYRKDSKPEELFASRNCNNVNQIDDIPERDEHIHVSSSSQQQPNSKVGFTDAATMTEGLNGSELTSNRSKKNLWARAGRNVQSKLKTSQFTLKDKGSFPAKQVNKGSSSVENAKQKSLEPKSLKSSVKQVDLDQELPTQTGDAATGSAAEKDSVSAQASNSEGRIITSSQRRRKRKKSQCASNKSTLDKVNNTEGDQQQNTEAVVSCVYTSKQYPKEQADVKADSDLVLALEDEQTNSDVIIEEELVEEAVVEQSIQSGTEHKHDEVINGCTSKSCVRFQSKKASVDTLRSRSVPCDQQNFRSLGKSRVYKRTWTNKKTVSPHKLAKPHPVRPKPSPVKYPAGFDGAYFTNAYQYHMPHGGGGGGGGGKFSYYYRRNSYHSSAGYYSHFGSPGHPEIEGNNQIQDFMDNFGHKRKVSREVLFLQQQVYQKDDWPKSEDEEFELQEDMEGYCRDECHSAPPLPYHHGYHCMTPEKSPYSPRSPHFRRTPGAHRPPSRARQFSGERPSSSLSNRSCSSPDSYSSYCYPDSAVQFRPIRFGLPHVPQGYGDHTMDGDDDEHAVELMVSNLDYNISAKEWRKILYAEFHQHVQVIDVHILTQPDNTNIGYIKVPTMEEANYALSQFHRKKIGYKRIHVTIVNHDDDSIVNAKTNVVTILQEVPSRQLSLYKLMELYEKRFHHPVTASEIYSFQDVLCIMEVEGQGRIVRLLSADRGLGSQSTELTPDAPEDLYCTVHCTDGSTAYQHMLETMAMPFVVLQLRSFSAQLHTLLQDHAGSLPLISFPICYQAEFGSLNTVSHGGVALEHLITSVPGVCIQSTRSGSKQVQWAENRVATILEQGTLCSNSILSQQLAQFSREVVMLLKNTPQCCIPVNKFIPTYLHMFGRQCRVADYGYTKLTELLDAIPHIVQVIGHGNLKFVTLTHRAQVKRFAMDILRVLKSQASKQISLQDLPTAYSKVFGKPFDITDYGLCYLEDILQELPENTFAITGSGDDMVFSLPRRDQTPEEIERTKQFALEVIDLLKHSPQCRIPFNRFIPAYHHHFGKQCRVSDYGFTKLVELFEAIPHVLKITDEQDDRVLTLVESELLKVLEEQVVALLKSCPDHKLPVPEFLASFTKFHGHSLRLQDYGVTSVVQLIEKIDRIAQMESQDGKYIIKLIDDTHIQMLAHHVLLLLMEQLDGSMPLDTLQERYRHLFGYGVTEMELKNDLKDLVQIATIGGKKIVKLCPLQMFARDVRTLLRHHHGRLPLAQFEFSYANHFGVQLVPASYGYSNAMNLLQAIPHVVQLRGKGYNITVVLCQDFQGKLYTGPPTHVEHGTSPIPMDSTAEEGNTLTSSTQEAQHNQEAESDLMSTSSACNTPCDLLAATVPSCVPSPELKPTSVLTAGDLIRFDSSITTDLNDVFSGLSPEEKRGQKTPLCKTPVSDMLQLAAQLLPASPCPLTPPPGNPYNCSYRGTAEYSALNPGHYLYSVPPVPRNATHVSTLEQQENGVVPASIQNYKTGAPDDASSPREQSCDQVCKPTEPGLVTDRSGTLCIQSSDSMSGDGCPGLSHISFGTIGGTLFWSKHENGKDPDANLAQSPGLGSSSSAISSSPATDQNMRDTSSPKAVGGMQNLASDDASKSSVALDCKTLDPIRDSAGKSALSESFSSPPGSPTCSVAERLCRIDLDSSPAIPTTPREHDDQQQGQEVHPLMDSGIASPGSLPKNHGSGAEEDLDGSTLSTPSPTRKLGTPRRSRLAAKFTASDVNNS